MTDKKLIWIALLPAITLPFIASLFYFVFFSEHFFAIIIYTAAKIFTVVWPLLSYFLIFRDPLPKLQLISKENKRAVLPGILSGLVIVGLMVVLMQTNMGETVMAGGGNIKAKAKNFGILEHYWLFAIFLSLIHSMIEEYYWRWFVYGNLSRVVPGFSSHLIAGMSFAAHHIVIASQFFSLSWGILIGCLVGAGGILWSKMYERQKTLFGAWLSHLIVDLGIMSIGYYLLFYA
jgi:membrane protease YdiL (CAAX protease family)